MQRASTEMWSVRPGLLLGALQPVHRLDALPPNGTVVALVKKGGHPNLDRRGSAIVRDGKPARISDAAAVEIHDPTRTAERRYRRAVTTAGLPDRATRFVEPAGHTLEADTVSPYGEPGRYGQPHVACTRVRGRQVWLRAATWAEVTSLGANLG